MMLGLSIWHLVVALGAIGLITNEKALFAGALIIALFAGLGII